MAGTKSKEVKLKPQQLMQIQIEVGRNYVTALSALMTSKDEVCNYFCIDSIKYIKKKMFYC